jgi:glyoxylase-like metal-dependent hydrolase (beta-lactamase superfamily II)
MKPVEPSLASPSGRILRSPDRRLPQVHQITMPTPWERMPSVAAYLVEGHPLTLIDSGLDDPACFAALGAGLEALGYAPRDVERVALTHYHVDHLGGVAALRRAGADFEVWAHCDALAAIENFRVEHSEDMVGMEALLREFGAPEAVLREFVAHRHGRLAAQPAWAAATPVDRVLQDGDALEFKDISFEVIHGPGHTAGHLLFLHRDAGTLLTGDTIMSGAIPHTENYYLDGLPEPGDPLRRRPRFKGLAAYRQTLKALRRLPIKTILPGYGSIVRAPDRAIREALLFYDVRIQRIERSLRSVTAMGQAVTAYEIWRGMYPNDDVRTEMRDKLLMVIGALDVLEEDGLCVSARRDDGVLVHQHSS